MEPDFSERWFVYEASRHELNLMERHGDQNRDKPKKHNFY